MPVSPADLQGLYKQAYPDGIEKLYPDVMKLGKLVKFSEKARVGDKYHQPVILTREGGVTYALPGAGAYNLKPAKGMTMKDAQIEGSQITVRSQIAVDTVERSKGSGAAFKNATVPIFESNLETHGKRLEIAYFYGQSATGIGQTSTAGATADLTTQETVVITDATWAVGIWSAEEGSDVNFYKNSDNTLVGTGPFTIAGVDPDNKKITVTGIAADCTALHTAVQAGALNVYFDYAATGATRTYNEMLGIDRALTIGAAQTLFNISTNYTLWRGNAYAVPSGPLSVTRMQSAVNRAVGKGGLGEKVYAFVSIDTWPNLAEQFLAAQIGAQSSSNAEAGVETIKYIGPNGATIEVVPHSIIKGGEAFVLPLKRVVRGGTVEPTMEAGGQGEMFTWIPDKNGFEVRSYSDQFILPVQPAKCVKITGIVNNA